MQENITIDLQKGNKMAKAVRGCKITLEQILNGDNPNGAFHHQVVPVKATLLSLNMGVVVEDESNTAYIVTTGDWFRNGTQGLPQVSFFQELHDTNYTVLKLEKKDDNKKLEVENNIDAQTNDEVLPANKKGKRKVEDRTGDA